MSHPFDDLTYARTGEKVKTIERLNEIVNQRILDERAKSVEDFKSTHIFTTAGRKKGTTKRSETDRQQIYQLHQQGVSNREIADLYGISEKTVRNYIKMEQ